MSKEAEPIAANDAVLEPADADYRFSAKASIIQVNISFLISIRSKLYLPS